MGVTMLQIGGIVSKLSALGRFALTFHRNQVGAAGDQPDAAAEAAAAEAAKAEAAAEEANLKKRFQAEQRAKQQLFSKLGVKNQAEADARLEELLAKDGRDEPLPRAREPKAWTPKDGEPDLPDRDDAKYERDAYGEFTSDGRATYKAEMAAYHRNMAAMARTEADREATAAALPKNLDAAIAALPEKWREAPEKWEGDVPWDEFVKDTIGGLAHAGLGAGEVASPDDLAHATKQFQAMVKHLVARETATADSEAAAERAKVSPQAGRGQPGQVQTDNPAAPIEKPLSGVRKKQAIGEYIHNVMATSPPIER